MYDELKLVSTDAEEPLTLDEFAALLDHVASRQARGEEVFQEVSFTEAMDALFRTQAVFSRGKLEHLNVLNYHANRDRLQAGRGLHEFADKYVGIPGILVAAGPSLLKNIDQLHRVKGRYPILAVDAALRVLLDHGLDPDLVFVIDTKASHATLFHGVRSHATLLACAAVHPETLAAWPGEIRYFNTWGDDDLHRLQLEVGQDFGSLSCGGNVSTAMAYFATAWLRCQPIILVGHDFSYIDFEQYYAGEHHQENRPHEKRRLTVYDHAGDPCLTDLSLFSYKEWTERFIRESTAKGAMTRWINATEGGILGLNEDHEPIPLIEYRSLKDVLDHLENSG